MADCRQMREIISRYVDGELTDGEKQALEHHLEVCPSCRSVLKAYESISAASAESMEEPPSDFTENIMKAIKQLPNETVADISAKGHKKTIRTITVTFAAAAACLALVLIAAPQLFGGYSSTKDASMSVQATEYSAVYEAMPELESGTLGSEMTNDSCSIDDEMTESQRSDESDQAEDAPMVYATSGDMGAGQDDAVPELSSVPFEPTSGIPAEEQSEAELLKTYYAVIYIEGQLPDALQNRTATETEDGKAEIEITPDTADILLAEGYAALSGNPSAETALVIYIPDKAGEN